MRISDWSSDVCSSDLWTASESAPAFRLKLAPVRLNVPPRTCQCATAITEAPAAAIVVGDHRVEPIHVVIAVVVDSRLRTIHADVFGQAIPKDRKSTRLNSSHSCATRMPSSACKKKQTTNI